MTTTTIPYRFVVKRATAAAFTAANTLLLAGEWALETDTGKLKMGDGVTAWNALPYVTTDKIPEGTTNRYYTDERAQDAIAALIAAGTHTGITFAYNDAGNALSATVTASGSGVTDGDKGDIVVSGSGAAWALESNLKKGAIGCTFDGGGNPLTVNTFCDVLVPYNCTITKATLLADQTGSLVVGVWKDIYGNFPPNAGDNIAASAPPTLSSAIKSQDSTLTGWTTTLTAGDIVRFNVNSVATITRARLTLEVTKT